jgi:hypothetical protein
MKKLKSSAGILTALFLPLALVRPSSSETIEHGEYGPGSNIPADSASLCEPLPDGVEFIPELKSGWAVKSSSTGGLRLMFSDLAMECNEHADESLMDAAGDNCINAWTSSFALPPEISAPGTYNLADYIVAFEPLTLHHEPGFSCSGCDSPGAVGGAQRYDGHGPDAILELYSVTDDCVTGQIIGLDSGQNWPPPPEYNGGFHAVRCN